MPNVCKYWIEDEPSTCSYWDSSKTICTFEGTDSYGNPYKAPGYPYCNLIGTLLTCNNYTGTGTQKRCVLPDPYRHVCNRLTGNKWVTVTGTAVYNADGEITSLAQWDWSAITEYNDGMCDGNGTSVRCTGYSPYDMAFGKIQPEPLPQDLLTELEKPWTGYKTVDDLGYRLPLSYTVWNRRAQLSRCAWWDGDVVLFDINESMGYINPFTSKCTKADPYVDQFKDHQLLDNGTYSAPCNGCKAECAYYTGICWEYCVDSKMQEGSKVLGEQLLELRYYLKGHKWDYSEYIKSFDDPHIYAWLGPNDLVLKYLADGNIDIENSIITAVHLYQDNFDYLTINKEEVPLTKGTASQHGNAYYPTLVRNIKNISAVPVIKNVFDEVDDVNIVETSKIENDSILIFGESFWFDFPTYGINLEDPELNNILPIELSQYNNMQSIEDSMTTETFSDFYDKLDQTISNLVAYCPEKMVGSSFGEKNNMFHIDVPTIFGLNEIIVFNNGSGRWEFDKIIFEKRLCGGIIGQTSFRVDGGSDPIDYLPNYEEGFRTDSNNNGSIGFTFFPFNPGDQALISYVYNDSVLQLLPNEPGGAVGANFYLVNHKKYKCTAFDTLILGQENICFYGNAGYALITIPDEENILNNAIAPWEIDGDIIMTTIDDAGNSSNAKFEIAYQNVLGLETNQIIIRPENLDSFFKPCPPSLVIDKIYVYEKRSFGEEPGFEEKEEVRLESAEESDSVTYVESAAIKANDGNSYVLTEFDTSTLLISVVFKGVTGRIRGVTRTKMITWVKQPFCRDVEIFYRWKASYTTEELYPWLDCYGKRGYKYFPDPTYHSRIPPCADHDIGSYSGNGPIWYPYNACDPYERYNIITQFTEFDVSKIEQFDYTDDNGDSLHGAFDIRMLGPDDVYGYTADVHTAIWNCNCDFTFRNDRKKNLSSGSSKNVFDGYGRYRGGLSALDLAKCIKNEGRLPKFGNVSRDFIRSYRSVDNISYYRLYTNEYFRDRKWVPITEHFSLSDITSSVESSLFKLNVEDYTLPLMDQMGLMLASSMENIDINETMDEERYRFEEVFDTLYTFTTIAYPQPKVVYVVGAVEPKTLMAWYRFKDHPTSGSDQSIQWAWQEIWKDIERANMIEYLSDDNLINSLYTIPYDETGEGKHNFITFEYPEYIYDAKLIEHRVVCEEGEHTISIIPCNPNDEGYVFFLLMLDGGPFRVFDLDGNIDPDVPDGVEFDYDDYSDNREKYKNLYEWCIGDSWIETVNLFESGTDIFDTKEEYEDKAKDDERVVETYDDIGELVETFYQRGLNITLLPANFANLPGKITIVNPGLYGIKLDRLPDECDTVYLAPEALEFYAPAYYYLDLKYYCPITEGYAEIKFNFKSGDAEEFRKRVISRIQIVFTTGAIQATESIGEWSGTLYHKPAVEVLVSNDDIAYTSIYNDTVMEPSTKNSGAPQEQMLEHDMGFSKSLFENPVNFVKLRFRLTPTYDEKEEAGLSNYYILCKNWVHVKYVYLYETEFMQGTETITTYERKYNISYGKHGDFPPHGTETTGSLLYPINSDLSAVYQYDSVYGVVGLPNSTGILTTTNKVRGRLMEASHPDKELLPGKDIYIWEAEQKRIHDYIIDRAPNTITMKSNCPPSLKERLDEIGVNFPTWTCTFFNTYPRPLAQVLAKEPYSPCGHEFHHNWESVDLSEWDMCGRLFGRVFVNDRFYYAYRNACSEEAGSDQIDLFEYVTHATLGAYKLNPLVYEQADQIRMARMDYSTNTTEDITDFSLPVEIEPFL